LSGDTQLIGILTGRGDVFRDGISAPWLSFPQVLRQQQQFNQGKGSCWQVKILN
jgi:hypothetical protein